MEEEPKRDLRDVYFSVVVPAFNEVGSVRELHHEIANVLSSLGKEYEIIYVDDGSYDGTNEVLSKLKSMDPRVQLIQFRRNHGKSAAYSRGFLSAKGRVIITMDADLQDDPGEIPKLLKLLDDGHDLIIGWKQNRLSNEPAKKTVSWAFNRIVRMFLGIKLHDSNSGFRAMRREVAKSLDLYGDLYRFIPEIAYSKGYKVGEVGVLHRRRKYGQTKYGPSRFWTGFLDLLTVRFLSRFIQKPLHFFGTIGLFPLSMGLALEIYVLAKKFSGEAFATHLAALIIGVMLILVGLQFIATGLIGEMLSKQSTRDYPDG